MQPKQKSNSSSIRVIEISGFGLSLQSWGKPCIEFILLKSKIKKKIIRGERTRRKKNWTNESFVVVGSLMTSLYDALWLLSPGSPPGPISVARWAWPGARVTISAWAASSARHYSLGSFVLLVGRWGATGVISKLKQDVPLVSQAVKDSISSAVSVMQDGLS